MCLVCRKVNTRAEQRKAAASRRPLDLASSPSMLALVLTKLPHYLINNHRLPTGLCPKHHRKFRAKKVTAADLASIRELLAQKPWRQTKCSLDEPCVLCNAVIESQSERSSQFIRRSRGK